MLMLPLFTAAKSLHKANPSPAPFEDILEEEAEALGHAPESYPDGSRQNIFKPACG
jgi:hypothetical protein